MMYVVRSYKYAPKPLGSGLKEEKPARGLRGLKNQAKNGMRLRWHLRIFGPGLKNTLVNL